MAIVSVNSSLSADIKGVDGVPNTAIKSINAATFPTPIAPFIMEIDSANLTSQTMTLGLTSTGTYDFDVDWGDGSPVTTITVYNSPDATHVYSASQKYTITLQPNTATGLREYNFGNTAGTHNEHLSYTSIISFGDLYLNLSITSLFELCQNLNWNTATAGIPNFSNKSFGRHAFRDCDSLTADISGWGTALSPITGDSRNFYYFSHPPAPNSFNCNFVFNPTTTSIDSAFSGTTYNNPLSNWDVSGMTLFTSCFNNANEFNQDISMWDTSSAIDMRSMFQNANAFNQNLPNWNVSNVGNMNNMFYLASNFNGTLTNWTTTSLTTTIQMFQQASNFNQPLDHFDVSNVTSMNLMFYFAISFNQDLNSWNTASVFSFFRTFRNASVFNGNISAWNTANVTNFRDMFRSCSNFTGNWGAGGNIGSWNTSSATNISGVFYNANNMTADLRNWNVGSATDFSNTFNQASSTSFSLILWRIYSATTMTSFASNSGFTDQQCEDAFVAWSNDPLTATNVNATSIWGNRTYPIGGPMQTATNKLTSATYNWTITGLTFV